MDTAEMLELGAKAVLVRLVKEIESVIVAVPSANRFARDLMREALGMAKMGRPKTINGTTAERLRSALIESRAKRQRKTPERQPWTDAQKVAIQKRMAARWALAKRLGYTGSTIPTNATLNKLRTKAGKGSTAVIAAKAAKTAKTAKSNGKTSPSHTAADQSTPAA